MIPPCILDSMFSFSEQDLNIPSLSTPEGCFSTSLTPFNYINGKLIWKGQTQKQLNCFCFVYEEFELLRNVQLRYKPEEHRTSCTEGQTLDIRHLNADKQ